MAPHANHGVSVRHDAPFDDGVVQVKFRIHDSKGIGFNFNDPNYKVSHAGHICHVGVKPKQEDLRDGKAGIFDLKIREKRLAGASKEEINALTRDKFAYHDVDLELGRWYELKILIRGGVMSAWIDGVSVGSLKSYGIDHAVKQDTAFAVSGSVIIRLGNCSTSALYLTFFCIPQLHCIAIQQSHRPQQALHPLHHPPS